MKTNWNATHRIQLVKMKDDRFMTIDRGDINQIKNCIEQYCGFEFSNLVNYILDDFIIRLEHCGYYLENIGYRPIDTDVLEHYWSPAVPEQLPDTYYTLAEMAKSILEEMKNET